MGVCSFLSVASSHKTDTPYYTQQEIANVLGWKTSNKKDHLPCDGTYQQPKYISDTPIPPAADKTPITITAKGTVTFNTKGDTVLNDHVVISQPGRLILADKAVVKRNATSGKMTRIILIGHVKIMQNNKLLAGSYATLDTRKNKLTIYHAIYHINGTHTYATQHTLFNAWGQAKKIVHLANGNLLLDHASYSTCSPANPDWVLSIKHLKLDQNKQKATAKDVVMRIKKVPLLWSPYYSFSLSKARKSGMLTPTMGYSTDHGVYFGVPIYWNIAPNQDFLFTPEYYGRRGTQLNTLFRYMTPHTDGFVYASILPDDRNFYWFKKSAPKNYSGSLFQPYINALNKENNDRGFIDFENDTIYNKYFKSKLYVKYVSDDYYAKDFPSKFISNNTNQLPSIGEISYQGKHWHDALLIQAYQTLHTIDQATSPAQNQYTRLPEFDATGQYPNITNGFDLLIDAQAVNFDYHSNFYPFTYQRPIGERFHLRPTISHPFDWAGGYITPALSIDTTTYVSQNATTLGTPRSSFNVNRTLPIIDIDTGLYFDRTFSFHHHQYIQTLQPRLFYLYVPYLNQNNYPNFDTQLLPFSYDNLFSLNRFSGYDRLQNANQLSLGITSNILRQSDASSLLSAQLGFITYFTNPKVCLTNNCNFSKQPFSPVTASLTYTPTSRWSLSGSVAWDPERKQINNGQLNGAFKLDSQHIALLGYQFAHGNPDTPFDAEGFSTNSSLIKAGLLWPFFHRWHFFGYMYYDLSKHRPEDQYVGLGYRTCCYALRFIVRSSFNGTQQLKGGGFRNQFTSSYFVQLSLTGLGSTGSSGAEKLLTSNFSGFQDPLSPTGKYTYDFPR